MLHCGYDRVVKRVNRDGVNNDCTKSVVFFNRSFNVRKDSAEK